MLCGPMSRIMSSSATCSTAFRVGAAVADNSRATTTSIGIGTLPGNLSRIARAWPTRSGSASERTNATSGGEYEGVGDATADDQRVDLGSEIRKHRQFGRHLRAGDDRDERTRRIGQRLAERVELGGEQRAGAGNRRVTGDAVRGRLGAMRGAEGVVDIDVTERGHLSCQCVVVFLFAYVEAAIFQAAPARQARSAACHAPPATQSRMSGTSRPEQLAQPLGDRRERIRGAELALGRAGPGARSPLRRHLGQARRGCQAPRRGCACRR